jgi:hypothetical protein
LEEGEEGYEEQ